MNYNKELIRNFFWVLKFVYRLAFSTANSDVNAGPASALESMGAKPTFRCNSLIFFF